MPYPLRAAAIALALLAPAAAQATVFKVTLDGAFTFDQVAGEAIDPIPFHGWFFVDGDPDQVESNLGLVVYGYADSSIRWVHVSAFGVRFSASDIADRIFTSGGKGSAVFLSQPLARGATPHIWMAFDHPGPAPDALASLGLGGAWCSADACGFYDRISADLFDRDTRSYLGPLQVRVSNVPEPAAWAMMLLGSGAAGGAMRWRRSRPGLTARSV